MRKKGCSMVVVACALIFLCGISVSDVYSDEWVDCTVKMTGHANGQTYFQLSDLAGTKFTNKWFRLQGSTDAAAYRFSANQALATALTAISSEKNVKVNINNYTDAMPIIYTIYIIK